MLDALDIPAETSDTVSKVWECGGVIVWEFMISRDLLRVFPCCHITLFVLHQQLVQLLMYVARLQMTCNCQACFASFGHRKTKYRKTYHLEYRKA